VVFLEYRVTHEGQDFFGIQGHPTRIGLFGIQGHPFFGIQGHPRRIGLFWNTGPPTKDRTLLEYRATHEG